jgi:hypothetical protein
LCEAGADLGVVGPETYTIFVALFKKKMQNYEYKFRESEYLFRRRKEITTSYKLKTLTNITNIIKSRKIICLLINCLTHFYNTFLLTFFGCILVDHLFI